MSIADQTPPDRQRWDADSRAAEADFNAGRREEFREDMRAELDAERAVSGPTDAQILWDRRNQVRDEVARVFVERDYLSWTEARSVGEAYAGSVSEDYLRRPWSEQRLEEAVTAAGQLQRQNRAAAEWAAQPRTLVGNAFRHVPLREAKRYAPAESPTLPELPLNPDHARRVPVHPDPGMDNWFREEQFRRSRENAGQQVEYRERGLYDRAYEKLRRQYESYQSAMAEIARTGPAPQVQAWQPTAAPGWEVEPVRPSWEQSATATPPAAAPSSSAGSAVSRLRALVTRVQAVNSAPTNAVAAGAVEASRVLVEQTRSAVAPPAEQSGTRATPSWGPSADVQPQREIDHGR